MSQSKHLPDLFAFMNEREAIRRRRFVDRLPGPWTEDKILRTFKFTNVMREHDRVSQYIQRTVTDRFRTHPDLWLALAACRLLNREASIEVAVPAMLQAGRVLPRQLENACRAVLRQQERGLTVFSAAYIVKGDPCEDTKVEYVFRHTLRQLLDQRPPMGSMQEFTTWLAAFYNWGGFLAYEVACDLRWAGPKWLGNAPDIKTWAHAGPGAVRGLNRIYGRTVPGVKVSRHQKAPGALNEMRVLLYEADLYEWTVPWERPFEMRDIEHSLCEFDKYLRAAHGEGRPKQLFDPQDRRPVFPGLTRALT